MNNECICETCLYILDCVIVLKNNDCNRYRNESKLTEKILEKDIGLTDTNIGEYYGKNNSSTKNEH